jgi:hypothetical protein
MQDRYGKYDMILVSDLETKIGLPIKSKQDYIDWIKK